MQLAIRARDTGVGYDLGLRAQEEAKMLGNSAAIPRCGTTRLPRPGRRLRGQLSRNPARVFEVYTFSDDAFRVASSRAALVTPSRHPYPSRVAVMNSHDLAGNRWQRPRTSSIPAVNLLSCDGLVFRISTLMTWTWKGRPMQPPQRQVTAVPPGAHNGDVFKVGSMASDTDAIKPPPRTPMPPPVSMLRVDDVELDP